MDEIQKRIEDLQRRHAQLIQRKATAAGQLQARKDELSAIVDEIRAAGFDPKHITQIRDQARADLIEEINRHEAELSAVETALQGFPSIK